MVWLMEEKKKEKKKRLGKIEILFGKKKGTFYFRVRSSNGKILCHSETYNSLRGVNRGVESIKTTITGGAEVVKL